MTSAGTRTPRTVATGTDLGDRRSLRFALIFGGLAIVCLIAGWSIEPGPATVLLVAGAASTAAVAAGFAGAGPNVFLKGRDGRLTIGSWLLHWPYLIVNWLIFRGYCLSGREEPATEVVAGLWVGRLPLSAEFERWRRDRPAAVLDLACECHEPLVARRAGRYLYLPSLDTTPPTRRHLEIAVRWIHRSLEEGPVLVHCAMGHGRSVVTVAAYLLATGRAGDPDEAIELIRAVRPRVSPYERQMGALRRFAEDVPRLPDRPAPAAGP